MCLSAALLLLLTHSTHLSLKKLLHGLHHCVTGRPLQSVPLSQPCVEKRFSPAVRRSWQHPEQHTGLRAQSCDVFEHHWHCVTRIGFILCQSDFFAVSSFTTSTSPWGSAHMSWRIGSQPLSWFRFSLDCWWLVTDSWPFQLKDGTIKVVNKTTHQFPKHVLKLYLATPIHFRRHFCRLPLWLPRPFWSAQSPPRCPAWKETTGRRMFNGGGAFGLNGKTKCLAKWKYVRVSAHQVQGDTLNTSF